ncbi:MAG: hypothetical protein KDN20_16765 [Verrucomicrobiae bacterium]|nr:hypothetical protein [Verrucomicrobiae bacterium]
MMKPLFRFLPIAALITLNSCSDPGPREIVEVRELSGKEQEIVVADSPAERFRMPSQMSGGAASGGAGEAALPFVWTTPEGWERQLGAPMRDLSFTIGEAKEGECYLSRLPGAGGGLTANVNRWRGQMGAEPMTDEEIAALPKKPLFGLEGVFVDVTGEFSGMGAAGAKPNYRMLGIILTSEAGAVFVKMTGPAELVAANEANFDLFCQSLKPR